jgi:hypothetical protein
MVPFLDMVNDPADQFGDPSENALRQRGHEKISAGSFDSALALSSLGSAQDDNL